MGGDGTPMPKDCGSAPLDSSLLLLGTLPTGHVIVQALLRWESLTEGVLFWCQGWQFYKECQGLGVGKSCEDAGTGEKSSVKLRPITLMSRAGAADPQGLCRPPSFGFNSVSYTILDAHRLKSSR